MSTHANVIVKMQDGLYRRIYNHFDGHTLGERLRAGYRTQEAAEALVNMGDASFIDSTLEASLFYHRDRGDSKKVEFSANLPRRWFDAEYVYLWTGAEWLVMDDFNSPEGLAVHRISDAAEAALHRVAKTEGTNKLGDILSRLIIDYERGLSFEDRASRGRKH